MLVQLTERNLMLSEVIATFCLSSLSSHLGQKIEEMRITIEDLEALKELNDELEENHVETEKGMQEDLGIRLDNEPGMHQLNLLSDLKDTEIRQHVRKVESLEENCQDLENTINQFREFVLQLQRCVSTTQLISCKLTWLFFPSECDALRAQTQTAQNESASASSQTAAMMSMNIRLQSSASKIQARNIEFELKKWEARESKELLAIVQVMFCSEFAPPAVFICPLA